MKTSGKSRGPSRFKRWLGNLGIVLAVAVMLAAWILSPWYVVVGLVVALAAWLGLTRRGRQTLAVAAVGIAGLPQRWGASMVIVIGIAGVVAVLVAMLAMGKGFEATLNQTGGEDSAIILRGGSQAETNSVISREQVPLISSLAGIAEGTDGRPLVSPELSQVVNLPTLADGNDANVQLRGVGPKAWELRPDVQIVEGRKFEPGLRELVVGKGAQAQFAGLEVGRIHRLARSAGGIAPDGVAVQVREPYRCGTSAPVRARRSCDPVEDRGARSAGEALAERVGEGDGLAGGRAEARGLEIIGGADERADSLRTRRRLGICRGLVPMLHGRRRRRRREAGPAGIDRPQAGCLDGSRHETLDRLVIGLVGERFCDASVECDAQVNAVDRIGDVLVDEAGGEACQRVTPGRDGHFGFRLRADPGQHSLADVQQAVAHPCTPTRMPRKRQGTEGCPVWPICCGCPLPQFGVPQNVHSDSLPSMSRLAQKRGPIPV